MSSLTSTPSLVASEKQTLDKAKLVSLTNRAQAICLILGHDDLVLPAAQDLYLQANEIMIKAMNRCIR